MLKVSLQINQPSIISIKFNRVVRFLKVGVFLHFMAIFGVLLTLVVFQIALYFYQTNYSIAAGFFMVFTIQCATMPIFAELDALGRYQNYKQIKDVLHKMGFDERLLKPFLHSKCQRDAIRVAAKDLKMTTEVKESFYRKGYRFYHILPDAFVKNPLVLFKKQFWNKILFTKHYELQNFYW